MDLQPQIDAAKKQGMHVYGTSDGRVFTSSQDLGENPDDKMVQSSGKELTAVVPDKIYSGSDTQAGRDYYSPEAIAARQAKFPSQIGAAIDPVIKNAPMIGAGLATMAVPEGAPWYWSAAAGAGGAGGAKALANKLTDKPAMQNVPSEAALGAVGGSLAKPVGRAIGYVAGKAAPFLADAAPALSKLLYGTEDAAAAKALTEGGKKLSGTLRNSVDDALEAIEESGSEPSAKLLDNLKKISLMKSDKFATTPLGKLFTGAANPAEKEAENIAWGHLQELQDKMGQGILNEGYSKYIPKLSQGIGGGLSDELAKMLMGNKVEEKAQWLDEKTRPFNTVPNSTVPTTQGK